MKKIGLAVVFGLAVIALGASNSFSQIPAAQDRIIQPVIINGQQVNAAYVTAPGGGVQSFTCQAPQQYVTPDGAGQGWAHAAIDKIRGRRNLRQHLSCRSASTRYDALQRTGAWRDA